MKHSFVPEKLEEKLQVFRENLYSKHREHFEVAGETYRILFAVIDENKNKVSRQFDSDNLFKWVIDFLFLKSYNLFWSILILCEEGFGPNAHILLRSLIEHVINMEWISIDDQKKRADLFWDYFAIARYHLVKNYVDTFFRY